MSGDFDLSLSFSLVLSLTLPLWEFCRKLQKANTNRRVRETAGYEAMPLLHCFKSGLELQCVAVHSQLLNIGKAVRCQ